MNTLTQPLAADGSPLVMRGLNTDSDLQGVCQLFSDVFSQPMDTAQWRWKYMQAPNSQHYHALAVHMHTGQVLGHMGVLIVPGVRGALPIRMAHATDLMISPLARTGLGTDSVYRHIMHTVRELALNADPGAPPLFMYGFPGRRPATLAIRLRIQRQLQICTEYVTHDSAALPLSAWQRLQQWWRKRNRLRVLAQPQPAEAAAWSDAVLDSLWQSHVHELAAQPPEQAQPSIAKTGAYLRWRYLNHPQQYAQPHTQHSQRYTLWLLNRPGHPPQGWLITSQQPKPTVVDSCLPMGDDWIEASLQALLTKTAGSWASWLPHPSAQAQATPIWATAMQGAQFYDHWPSPAFQPGDTDVF